MERSAATTPWLPFAQGWTCPGCGAWRHINVAHDCPALRDLSPMGGGPNPWKDKAK